MICRIIGFIILLNLWYSYTKYKIYELDADNDIRKIIINKNLT